MKKIVHDLNLENIKDPNYVKDLSYFECEELSKNIANYIIEKTSKYGGHLSSNLGCVDATISLCRSFDFNKDKLIFDVGHQCYTYKILTGRNLENLREQEGVCGFQDMEESKYDHYSAGHSSTSLSAANGLAIARDLKKENYDIVAFIGDSSISNGLAMEALNNIIFDNHKVIIVLNDNDMSISSPVGGLSNLFRKIAFNSSYIKFKNDLRKKYSNKVKSTFYTNAYKIKNFFKRLLISHNIFENLGYDYIGPIDGHDIKDMDKAFKLAKKTNKSVVVHIRTIKGKGYKPALNDPKGEFHGVGPFDINTGKSINKENYTWSKCYASYLDKLMEENPNTFLINPATRLGSSLEDTFDKFPDRCLDVGIAEEHAITMASGLYIGGYHPIISIYSSFLQRGYDEVLHDLSRLNVNATLLIDRAGLVGKDGETHQGIFDEAFLYEIPNTVIAMASKSAYVNSLLNESLNNHGVFAIRYPRDTLKKDNENIDIPFGKWNIIKEGKKSCLIGVGPNILKAAELLKDKDVLIVDAIYQKPFDHDLLNRIIKDYDNIVIYDSYGVTNGFANTLMVYLLENGYKGKITAKAVPNTFVKHMSISKQEKAYGLSPKDIASLF